MDAPGRVASRRLTGQGHGKLSSRPFAKGSTGARLTSLSKVRTITPIRLGRRVFRSQASASGG
jgi:hypothetical protein